MIKIRQPSILADFERKSAIRVHVTATVRTTTGINKAADAGGWMPQSASTVRCGESFRRRWPAISNFVAGSVRRFDASECR